MTAAERERFLSAGFSPDQVDEIEEGLRLGLNVGIYVNKNYLSIQMRQIRLGLMEHLPVEIYARVEYDWFQMEEIREGIKAKIDVSVYASPEIPYEKMRQMRKGLEAGINLSSYLKLDAGVLRQLRKAKVAGVNILKYINEGYDAEQLAEIRCALEKNVDIDSYLSKEYRGASIAEICMGLEEGVDVSLYAMACYSWRQMREIRIGLENRVDVGKYISRLYSWEQMREIRLGLEQGLDVDTYRLMRFPAGEMRKKRLAGLKDVHHNQELVPENQVKSVDFVFEFTTNDMEAYITVMAEGKVITRNNLLDILEQNDIRMGIQEDTVERIVAGRYGRNALLIARGQIPYKGEDGWYEYFFRTNLERKPKEREDGSVDYQNIEWFETVHRGQKIAFYHEAQEGTDGYNVRGEVVKARKGFEQRILTGKGFCLEEDRKTYTATLDGMITLKDNEINITSHLVMDEVNMVTGNVNFGGSVHILGDVCNGTVVKAAGDVMIDGNVEAVTIESGGSVILKKGMNSAGRGQITAEKNVISRFFEAARVSAKGNIEVDKCLNSQLYAGEKITSSRVIAGGVACAEQGFRLKHVGNQAGLTTVLKVKMSDQVRLESRRVKEAILDVEHELQMLNNSYEEFKEKYPPEVRFNMEIFDKLEKALYTKNKQHEQLVEVDKKIEKRVQLTNDAKVIIAGIAFEGTVLEINGGRWRADNQRDITIKRQANQVEVISN